MDDDNLSRALMIAVTVFIGIVTVSAIIIYFNISINTVRNIGSGMDYDQVYRDDIESSLLMNGTGNYIKGTSVKNIINYYEENMKVAIYIQNAKYVGDDSKVQIYNEIILDTTDLNSRKKAYRIGINTIMDNQDFIINIESLDEELETKLITIKGV